MEWFLLVWRKGLVFTGRAQRSELWFFVLFQCIIGLVVLLVAVLLHLGFLIFLLRVYGLVALVPSIAVTTRRLHDTDRSGWWQLIYFLPLIGAIVLLVFTCQDSDANENQYGSNPKLTSPFEMD